ncbi:MAG: TRAP transporter small permease [Gammaproteobacteria bacterium]|nr:TRAP transporter small permease [Gammaproteobacteria bacterium]
MEDTAQSPSARMLKRVDEGFFKFEKFLNLIASLVILGVMLIGVFQVFGRKLLNFPVPGYVDVIEMSMTVFAFVSIAYCQRLGGHVRMEIILGRLKGRVLYFLETFGTLVALCIVVILMFFGYDHFLRAWEIGDSTIDAEIPIWPSKLLVPFAFGILALRLLIQFFGFLRLLINPDAEQIGVPHLETVDEQAQKELDAGLAGEEEKVDLLSGDSPRVRR